MMKRALRAEGLPMMDYAVVRRSQWRREPDRVRAEAEARLGYPMFVKPANLGSSVGVHRIDDAGSFPGLVEDAAAYDTKVLIEAAALDCHEIECAVLGNDDPQASVVGEIVPSREFYDYDAKYVDEASELVIPAPLPPETAERVRELAVAAFRAVEARGLARVDFFVERSDERRIHVNEVNTMPGFTPISMYPKLWEGERDPLLRAHRPAHPARHRGAPRPPRRSRRPVASDSGRAPRAEPGNHIPEIRWTRSRFRHDFRPNPWNDRHRTPSWCARDSCEREGTAMKNITLSADEHLIDAARRRAAAERTTLNAQFRRWLEDYAGRRRQAEAAMAAIDSLRASMFTGGRTFTRDEMNER